MSYFRPQDYRFDRQTGLRDYHFRDYRPRIDWGAILMLSVAGFCIVTLLFFAVQVWR